MTITNDQKMIFNVALVMMLAPLKMVDGYEKGYDVYYAE